MACSNSQLNLVTDMNEILADFEDHHAFVEILKSMLHLDQDRRLTPVDALHHPFLNLTHLMELHLHSNM